MTEIESFSEDDPICFAKGVCRNGLLIAESITLGENSCLNFCRKVKDCSWFTYNSKNNFCMALSTCSEVSAEGCLDCLSGQVKVYFKTEFTPLICHNSLIRKKNWNVTQTFLLPYPPKIFINRKKFSQKAFAKFPKLIGIAKKHWIQKAFTKFPETTGIAKKHWIQIPLSDINF